MEGREQPEPGFVNILGAQESNPPAYEAWRPGTTTLYLTWLAESIPWIRFLRFLNVYKFGPSISILSKYKNNKEKTYSEVFFSLPSPPVSPFCIKIHWNSGVGNLCS
jgi:hypothetical protein